MDIPDDCNYLYVYVSNGTFYGKFHVYMNSWRKYINLLKKKAEGIVYINDIDQILRTIKHRHDGNFSSGFSASNWSDNLLVLAHISDVHTDSNVYTRFITFLNNNVDTINAGVVSGDLVDVGNDTQFSTMIECETNLSSRSKLIKCLGNHEMHNEYTKSQIYEYDNFDTNTGLCYYYIDFSTQKIRVICLDQYDTDSTEFNKKQATAHYSQTQINWFINVLDDAATNNYSVIVVSHSCNEVGFPIKDNDIFYQNIDYAMSNSPTSGCIISDIINAYQTATTINEVYTASDIAETITVNKTFSTKGVFICWLCGHEHVDAIGYSPVYPNQLIALVQGAVVDSLSRDENTAHWQNRYDTPRVSGTSTNDSINVYGIDTVNRLFKVIKIGSTITDKFVPRSFATFDY